MPNVFASAAELDRETTAYWIEVADSLDFPRSVGEVFGLILVATDPLTADDIVEAHYCPKQS